MFATHAWKNVHKKKEPYLSKSSCTSFFTLVPFVASRLLYHYQLKAPRLDSLASPICSCLFSRMKRYQNYLASLEPNPETSRPCFRILSTTTYSVLSPARERKKYLGTYSHSRFHLVVILCQFLDFGEKSLQTTMYHFYANVTRFLQIRFSTL